MIKGIGCDIVDLRRLYPNLDKLANKILTSKEYEVYLSKKTTKHKCEFVGGRFAGKEAFFKAYGIEHQMVSFHDIEILNDEAGKPFINFPNTFISISHDQDYAIAYVVVEDEK